MKAYIVRHTSVLWDGNETCYGETDIDVRPTFAEEAEVTLRALRGLSFDAVFSSPLQRARKLASYCGLWEGRPWVEIIRDEPVDEFFARYIEHPTPEGESLVMQYSRVEDFLREKRREGLGQILVFCHGGVINCARALAGTTRLVDAFATLPDFGSVTELDFSKL